MNRMIRKVSTVTDKGQTTVPKSIREALGVDYGGRIAFCLDERNRVYVEREDEEREDPVIDGFLDLLARDMAADPEKAVVAFPLELRARMEALSAGIDVNLDEPVDGDVDL